MKEILGYNLEKFFRRIEYPCDGGMFERTYKGTDYEVWAMTDNIFDIICDYSEDEFVELAGKDAWWRSSTGSVLGKPTARAIVNEKRLICWGR